MSARDDYGRLAELADMWIGEDAAELNTVLDEVERLRQENAALRRMGSDILLHVWNGPHDPVETCP